MGVGVATNVARGAGAVDQDLLRSNWALIVIQLSNLNRIVVLLGDDDRREDVGVRVATNVARGASCICAPALTQPNNISGKNRAFQ